MESRRISGRANGSRMSLATASASPPAPAPVAGSKGIPPLPLLTLLNFFNYMDRQVVYGMTDQIIERRSTSANSSSDWLALVNLIVFAIASAISGPIADRIGPRKVIFAGVAVWSARHHRLGAVALVPDRCSFCRALVGVGEGAYGPSANTLLCAAAPPDKRGRALGIYNVGMAFGGDQRPRARQRCWRRMMDWHGVFWIAGGPSILLAVARRSWRRRRASTRPTKLPGARLPARADLPDRAGGRHPVHLRRQRAGRLVAVADHRGAPLLRHASPTSSWPWSAWSAASAASSRAATWATRSPGAAARRPRLRDRAVAAGRPSRSASRRC